MSPPLLVTVYQHLATSCMPYNPLNTSTAHLQPDDITGTQQPYQHLACANDPQLWVATFTKPPSTGLPAC